MTETPKQQITLSLDPVLVLALDNIAKQSKTNRSAAFESLLVTGVQAQQARKEAAKKTPISIRVAPAVAEKIKAVAYNETLSVNEACAYLVERGLLSLTDDATRASVQALITQLETVAAEGQREHRAQTHRHAYLLSQMALEAMATRQMMAMLIATQPGIGTEGAQRLSQTAWGKALDQLRRPTSTMRAELQQLLRDLEMGDG